MKKVFITLGIVIVILVGGYITIKNLAIHSIDQYMQELAETKKEEQYSLDLNEDKDEDEFSQNSSDDEDEFFEDLNEEETIQQIIDEVEWEVDKRGTITIILGYFTNTQDFTIKRLSLDALLLDSTGAIVGNFPHFFSDIRPNDTILLQLKIPTSVDFTNFDFKARVTNVWVDNEIYHNHIVN